MMSSIQCHQCGGIVGIPHDVDRSDLKCQDCSANIFSEFSLPCQGCPEIFWVPDDYGRARIKCPKCSKWADIPDQMRLLARLKPQLARKKFSRLTKRLEHDGLLSSSSVATLGESLVQFSDCCVLFLLDELPFLTRALSQDQLWEALSLAGRMRDVSEDSCSQWDYCQDAVVAGYLAVWHPLMKRMGFEIFRKLVEERLSESMSAPFEIILWKSILPLYDNLGVTGLAKYWDWLDLLRQARQRENTNDPVADQELYLFHLDAMERIPELMENHQMEDCWSLLSRVAAVSRSESRILRNYSGIATCLYPEFIGCPVKKSMEPNSYSIAMRLGIEAMSSPDFSRPQKLFERALALSPKADACLFNLGLVYAKQAKFPEAIEVLNQALEIHPRHVKAWYQLGLVYGKRGDVMKSKATLEEGLEVNETGKYLTTALSSLHLGFSLKAPEDLEPYFRRLLTHLEQAHTKAGNSL